MNAMTAVPYFDLKRQYKSLQAEFEAALSDVAASGGYVLSQRVQEFEAAFARAMGSPIGIGVGSGTDALVFSLRALGIGPGDEVILPSFTFTATGFSILHTGATPVFADVDSDTFTLDPKSVEKCITSKTKALLPVHLYGQACDMDALRALAKSKKLCIVEDACQAHGAMWKNEKAGAMSDAGCFSFYPTKNLGAFGDGGMVITSNQLLADSIRRFRNLGRIDLKEAHQVLGWTSRLDAMQAAILNIKLAHLPAFNENRRRVAKRYFSGLESTPLLLPKEGKDRYHVYHLFVVRVPDGKRDALQKHLTEQQIPTMLHYPIPVHRQPSVAPLSRPGAPLDVTDQLRFEIMSLPIFPEMTDAEVDQVCGAVRSFYR